MDSSRTGAAGQPVAQASLRQALLFWLKLGFISFGGPAGQIALMHEELVTRRRWLSERRFLHALNYCMLLPGPEAQQLATYLGWLLHRTWGGVAAGLLFIVPSLLLLILLAWVYLVFGQVPLVAGLFYAIKPAVVVVVFQAAWRIGGRVLRNRWLWAIAALAFAAIFFLRVPFPLIVLGAALAGALGARCCPAAFSNDGGETAAAGGAPALIDDNTPTPEHARFSRLRLARLILLGAVLWCLPMLVLTAAVGWDGTLTQMAWFFTKAALLTFGGAYAVLPYVYQGAVVQFGWLSPLQMIDGLALGESTPCPLIMVVVFVAFVGGYLGQVLGPDQLLAGGVLAALLVCWFTFLPSFLFVLGGAPLIEATRGELGFSAPLTAVSAAVVGVILNLALFFAWHVFMPQGHGPDWLALGIAAVAGMLVFWRGWTALQTLLLCGAAGLLLGWAGWLP